MSTIHMNFHAVATHIVTLGRLTIEIKTDQLILLSLYLAYAINTENSHRFDLKTVNDQIISMGRGINGFSIVGTNLAGELYYTALPDEDAKKWSEELTRYACPINPVTPYLLCHDDYVQVDQELFIHKNALGIVYNTYGDDRDSSDLPIGLYVNEKAKSCYGIKAIMINDDNIVSNMFFNEECLTKLV